MNTLAKYYVYILYRDVELTDPFYVGKGCGKRFKHHEFDGKREGYVEKHNQLKHRAILKRLEQFGFVPYAIAKANMLETEAFDLEKKLIKSFGRLCDATGCLTNLTLGGDGGFAGLPRVISDETRARMSAAAKARKREPISAETRAKMIEGIRRYKKTPEHCAAISAAKKGTIVSEATRAVLSAAQKARAPRSAETIEKVRQFHLGRKRSLETRARMREGRKRAKLLREERVILQAQGA